MLLTRALSALVLAPPALLAVWWGGYAFAALAAAAAAIMAWEWHTIVTGRFGWGGRLTSAASALACLVAVASPLAALALVALAAVLAPTLAEPCRSVPPLADAKAARVWAGAGALYVGLPAVALVWLRGEGESGRLVLLWLLLLVWATDIGAYAFGRLIGGPRLAPRVSPKKTWAGLLGGMVCAGLVGAGFAAWAHVGDHWIVAVFSAVLAVVAQGGDLLESWVKRRWNVKDASAVIPGHGGVLDRVDGLLAAGGAVALATLASGESILTWL